MKKLLSFLTIAMVSVSAIAAPGSSDRRSMAQQWGSAPRVTASKSQVSAPNAVTVDKSSTQPITVDKPVAVSDKKDDRAKERAACIQNNIGVGNTFVWASRYSNTSNYMSMVEDVENPENNVCFVKIELKSDDSKISVSDIAPVYYEMGRNITCGSWADAGKIKQRILDAKKSARTWGTVAGAVGGAGVGVGAMELFGNRLIGGDVMGQKQYKNDPAKLLEVQVMALKEQSPAEFQKYQGYLATLNKECYGSDNVWDKTGEERPEACAKYKNLFDIK